MATTNVVSTNNTNWTLLGAGPMRIQPIMDTIKFSISDISPNTSANVGFFITPTHSLDSILCVNSTSNVWALSIANSGGEVIIGPL